MKSKVSEKMKVIELRKQGLSYKEILEIVPVAKSSLSGWLTNLDLTDEQISALKKRAVDGRTLGVFNAVISNRNRRIAREASIFKIAKIEFEKFKDDPFFVLGVSLYWAEGTKKFSEFQFINSDPQMIKIMVRWIKEYMGFSKESLKIRLFIHQPYADEKCEEFWSDILGIPSNTFYKTIYKQTPHNVKKNPKYKGCLRIGIGKIENLRKVLAWQRLLCDYYSVS
ncbi:MAG: hypothetical protein WCT49_00350 [Candidatus Paceibacterota bacterium]|jgi:hypothetical protein|nr:hypothetical protein [Candidatus Paceibacterota bacterium]